MNVKTVIYCTGLSVCSENGADLIAALQASPYRDIDIKPERYRLPVRGVTM